MISFATSNDGYDMAVPSHLPCHYSIHQPRKCNHCLLHNRIVWVWNTEDNLQGGVTEMFTLVAGSVPAGLGATAKCGSLWQFRATADVFPSFIPKEVERIKDPFARKLATRIERLPVQVKSTGVFGFREKISFLKNKCRKSEFT